jgi:hypothetical protein
MRSGCNYLDMEFDWCGHQISKIGIPFCNEVWPSLAMNQLKSKFLLAKLLLEICGIKVEKSKSNVISPSKIFLELSYM